MISISHEVWIDAPPERVFGLLGSAEGISTWWDEQTERETADGVVLEHTPGPEHGTVRFLVLETRPNELVRWKCVSTHPDNVPASEWTGTEISFAIGSRASSRVATEKWASEIPVQTVLKFEHSGWREDSKYLSFCNYAWADVLGKLARQAMGSRG